MCVQAKAKDAATTRNYDGEDVVVKDEWTDGETRASGNESSTGT
jgi:hypothetical protein